MARDSRKPLTSTVFSSSVCAPWADPIVQIGAFDGQRQITSSMFTFFKLTLKVWIMTC